MPRVASITCNQCQAAYTPVVIERSLPDGAVQMEHVCPACEAIYPIVRITETGIRLRNRMARLKRLGLGTTPQYRMIHDRYKRQVTRLTAAAVHNGAQTGQPEP